ECHDPTQGMRQGNDIGEQYRSTIYCTSQSQLELATRSKEVFQQTLDHAGFGKITTEIDLIKKSFPAEEYHQQYLGKNPNGYCNMQGTGCFL
ncbi:MAG: peptide-methionine (S)-S-oxide reductase MsrA, partial [SAR86 cluster bacterium]